MSDNNNREHEVTAGTAEGPPPQQMPSMPNVSQMNPQTVAAQRAMMKLLSTPPESIIELLDRVGVPWERTTLHGESCVVIKWFDLMKGEKKLQKDGPYFKKVMEEIRNEKKEGAFNDEPTPGT